MESRLTCPQKSFSCIHWSILYEIPNSENLCLYISHHKKLAQWDKSNDEGSKSPVRRNKWEIQYSVQKGVRDRYTQLDGWCTVSLELTQNIYRFCSRCRASLVAQTVKNLPTIQETWVPSLGREDPLEKGMATHSSILAWKIPWTEEPGSLQYMGSKRVGHNWTIYKASL